MQILKQKNGQTDDINNKTFHCRVKGLAFVYGITVLALVGCRQPLRLRPDGR